NGILHEEDLALGLSDRDEDRRMDLSDFENKHLADALPMGRFGWEESGKRESQLEGLEASAQLPFLFNKTGEFRSRGLSWRGRAYYGYPDYISWLDTLFPAVEPRPAKPTAPKEPETWSPEAI